MFNKLKHFIEKILSFNIGNLFKTEINNKIADMVKDNNLIKYNKTENNNTVIQQNFDIQIFSELNYQDALKKSFLIGNKNAKAVGDEVCKLLKENNVSQDKIQDKLSNPEFISTMAKANEMAYIIDDVDKRKLLSDLIYQKYVIDDEYNSNVLSQAISTMKNLTKNHLKLLSLFYMFRSGYLKEFNSIEKFLKFYEKYISKLTDIPSESIRDIGTAIIGNGCAVTYTFGCSVKDFFENQVAEYIVKLSAKEVISKEEELQINIIDILNKIWDNSGLASAFPTATGKCIGKIYLRDILGLNIIENDYKTTKNNNSVTHGDLSKIYKG